MSYSEKLKDPKWQKKRLEILERDNWECQICENKEKTLHVHHKYYADNVYNEPWIATNEVLITLCEDCHEDCHAQPKEEKYLLHAIYDSGAITQFNLMEFADVLHDSGVDFKSLIRFLTKKAMSNSKNG